MSDIHGFDPSDYQFDERPADEVTELPEPRPQHRVAVIRTSDRILFKKCRRRWGWNSHLRGNLGPKTNAAPLWFGSGFHFALEDFHGAGIYGSPVKAFEAYVIATRRKSKYSLPGDWAEHLELGRGMLSYYEEWLVGRQKLDTYVYRGKPQVEVNFRVSIPGDWTAYGYDEVVYSGTLDRVVIDEWGQLWILEYKTAKIVQTMHLGHDDQVSSYCWVGAHLYDKPIAGVIYQQHRKALPEDPRILASGKLSTNKQMLTTHRHYRASLINLYGSVQSAPGYAVEFLNYLSGIEAFEGDKFIRRDKAERNAHQCEAQGEKIVMEIHEMLNPELPLYPNPTRDCFYMCPFLGACVSLDDGSDWEQELEALMVPREAEYDSWRQFLPAPEELGAPAV